MTEKIVLIKREILESNQRAREVFLGNIGARRRYREIHPTEIMVTKCMDGRIDINAITGLPFGLVYPFRNIGGDYCVGWPLMRETLNDRVEYAHSRHRLSMLLATYHFSEKERHHGCAGFNYDKKAAMDSVRVFRDDVNNVFSDLIYPFMIGIETDSDGMIVHGETGKILDIRELASKNLTLDEASMVGLLRGISSYPDRIIEDLAPLLVGNLQHVKDLLKKPKEHESLDHQEGILALGQGFDWLKFTQRERAIIIGPCDPALSVAIVKAAGIIKKNVESGRFKGKHGILLISTPYYASIDGSGSLRRGAIEQSKYLASFALDCLRREMPEMAEFLIPMVGVTSLDSREFIEV